MLFFLSPLGQTLYNGVQSCCIINVYPLSSAFICLSQGNKGGVSARMMVFGHPVCFLNCHLPAHMRNLEQRMEDFESILQQQQFEGSTAVGVLDHEWVPLKKTFLDAQPYFCTINAALWIFLALQSVIHKTACVLQKIFWLCFSSECGLKH